MKYLHYHNTNADIYAQRYYALNYNELTAFQQDIVDNEIATVYLQN